MALTAFGFPGSVDSVAFASMARGFGSLREVDGALDYRVTAGTGDRAVRVGPGVAHAGGVRVVNDAPITLNLASVGFGSRWDLVALRRNWSTNAVSVVVVQGTATRALPAGRAQVPGVEDDQPLALVRVTAGDTQVTSIEDVRLWASKVYTAKSTLAIPDAAGVECVVDGVRWRQEVNATSTGVELVDSEASDRARERALSRTYMARVTTPTLTEGSINAQGTQLNGSVVTLTTPVGAVRALVRLDITGLSAAGNVNCVVRLASGASVINEQRLRDGSRHGFAQGEIAVGSGVPLQLQTYMRVESGANVVIPSGATVTYTVNFS